jgi:hypothetical protein
LWYICKFIVVLEVTSVYKMLALKQLSPEDVATWLGTKSGCSTACLFIWLNNSILVIR